MENVQVGPAMLLEEAARYVNASEWTIRRLYLSGEIRFQRLGKRYVFSKEDLDEYIERSWKSNARA